MARPNTRYNQLYSDNNEMHTINMSHNNLTQIESGWFESFHTKWSIGEREFAGNSKYSFLQKLTLI